MTVFKTIIISITVREVSSLQFLLLRRMLLCWWTYFQLIAPVHIIWYGIFVNCNWVATRWQ